MEVSWWRVEVGWWTMEVSYSYSGNVPPLPPHQE